MKQMPEDYRVQVSTETIKSANVSTLDEEMASVEKVLCLKLDVQGYELNVLQGGEITLQKTIFVLLEMNNHPYYAGGCQYFELDYFLRKRGFKLADIIVSYRSPERRIEEYDAIYQRV